MFTQSPAPIWGTWKERGMPSVEKKTGETGWQHSETLRSSRPSRKGKHLVSGDLPGQAMG